MDGSHQLLHGVSFLHCDVLFWHACAFRYGAFHLDARLYAGSIPGDVMPTGNVNGCEGYPSDLEMPSRCELCSIRQCAFSKISVFKQEKLFSDFPKIFVG